MSLKKKISFLCLIRTVLVCHKLRDNEKVDIKKKGILKKKETGYLGKLLYRLKLIMFILLKLTYIGQL